MYENANNKNLWVTQPEDMAGAGVTQSGPCGHSPGPGHGNTQLWLKAKCMRISI